MARKPKDPPPITEAEWAVMDALWRKSPRTAQDIYDDVASVQDWTLGTVKTLLARLLRKKAVAYDVDGKRYLYRAAVTKRACVKAAGRDLLARAAGEAKSPLLAFFLKESRLAPDEIQELRALLDQLEERKR